jgi:hypothetical protein
MAAGLNLRLRHVGLSRNPEAPMRLVDGRRAGATPSSESGRVEFSLVETRLSCELERTHEAGAERRSQRMYGTTAALRPSIVSIPTAKSC